MFHHPYRRTAAVLCLGGAALMSGCSTAGEGVASGAGIGALTGLIFGSLGGSAGEGAIIGTAAGAVVGGVIGDQNERNAYYSAQQAAGYRAGTHTTVIDRRPGWDARYGSRGSYGSYGSGTVIRENHYYYNNRYREPRVTVHYGYSPSRYKPYRYRTRSWWYDRDPYCR